MMFKIIKDKIPRKIQISQGIINDVRGYLLNPSKPSRSPVLGMYHSVSELPIRNWGPWQYSVTSKDFDKQLSRINKKYTIISIDELFKWLMDDEPIAHDSIILTFDDAYRDFKNEALPILEKYDFPATVYVPTRLLDDNRAPFEHRLGMELHERNKLNITVDDFTINASLRTKEEVVSTYNKIRNKFKFSSTELREDFLKKIETSSGSTDIILNAKELRKLHTHPLVTVGAHGHEHVPFTSLPREKQKINIETCRDQLTNILGSPPKHFSFPYGSFNDSAIQAVREAEFETAVTTQSRPVSPRDWGRPYTIPRIDAATESITSGMK
jgi:peptidoglycan/xylan/chitin deacetylase (PgdA/CDA1 family)